MSHRPSSRTRLAVLVIGAVSALLATAGPAAAARQSTTSTSMNVTVSLVCPAGNYERVLDVGLFDSRGNVVGAVGNLECGAGNLSTYPGPATYRQSVTVAVTKLPTQIGYGGEWRCADQARPDGSVVNEQPPVYIAFGPIFVGLNRKPPTTIPCQAKDASGNGYASSMVVSW